MSTDSSNPIKPKIPPPPTAAHPPPQPTTKPPIQPLPTVKPHQYHPKKRIIHTPPKRSCFSFCCCFLWSLVTFFILAAALAAAVGVFVLLYKPERPRFTIASLQMTNLTLSGNLDIDGSGRLISSGNLTISAKNPNSKITTFYDPVSMFTYTNRGVLLANASFRGFTSAPRNSTVLRFRFVNDENVDLDLARGLRSDLNRKSEVGARVELETKMGVKIGKWTTKKIGIKVLCEGLKVKVPKKAVVTKGLAPAPALAAGAVLAGISDDGSCKVNLSIKFWGFVF